MRLAALVFALFPLAAQADCGGDFGAFVKGLKAEAVAKGHAPAQVDAFFKGVRQDARVLKADRAQGVFRKTFADFAKALISQKPDHQWRGQRQEIPRHL